MHGQTGYLLYIEFLRHRFRHYDVLRSRRRVGREIPVKNPSRQGLDTHYPEKVVVDYQLDTGHTLAIIRKANDAPAGATIIADTDIDGRRRDTKHLRLRSKLRPQQRSK